MNEIFRINVYNNVAYISFYKRQSFIQPQKKGESRKMSEEIRYLSLVNKGAFVVALRVKGGSASYTTEYFSISKEKTVDLANIDGKVKDGDEVWLEAVVKLGKNNTAKQRFIYRKNSTKKASYSIKGTTLKNTLTYSGITGSTTQSSPSQSTKALDTIKGFSLKNTGAFSVSLRVKGGSATYTSSQFTSSKEEITDLSELTGKVKDGDEVWLEAVVALGKNNTATQHFIYKKNSSKLASYTIKGTTINNTLTYNGLKDMPSKTTAAPTTSTLDAISAIALKNSGAFVVNIRVKGGSASYNSGTFAVGKEKIVKLADAADKIKTGNEVWLEVVVKLGKNNVAKQHFIYKKTAGTCACYTIKGTTLKNTLTFNGLKKI